jgi:hypothetical protein
MKRFPRWRGGALALLAVMIVGGCGAATHAQRVESQPPPATTNTTPTATTPTVPPTTQPAPKPKQAKPHSPAPPPSGEPGASREKATVDVVTEDGSVLALDNGSVYSVSTGDASSWENDEVAIAQDHSSLTDLANGEKLDVSRVGDESGSNNPYPGTGDHNLDTKSSDGAIVVLEDGSVWSVDSADRASTDTWTAATSITVNEGSGNSYDLVDTDDQEVAAANYIGSK